VEWLCRPTAWSVCGGYAKAGSVCPFIDEGFRIAAEPAYSQQTEKEMAEKLESDQDVQEVTAQRPKRAKLTAEESLKRMEAFPERKEQIVASVRKSKGRSLSS